MMIDFSDLRIFFPALLISILLVFAAYKVKKSAFPFIGLVFYMVVLMKTALIEDAFVNRTFHFVITFLGILVNMVAYIITNDIEVRRKVVSKVFKNRYDK